MAAALAVVEPCCFGFDIDYVPIEELDTTINALKSE